MNQIEKQEESGTAGAETKEDNPSFLHKEGLPEPSVLFSEITALLSPGPFLDSVGRVAPRMFRVDSVNYLGYLIEETDDSFIVALLVRLEKNQDSQQVTATPPVSGSVTRILKASVAMVGRPSPVQILYFLSLSEPRFGEIPDYFTKARQDHIRFLIKSLEAQLNVSKLPTPPTGKRRVDGKIRVSEDMVSKLKH